MSQYPSLVGVTLGSQQARNVPAPLPSVGGPTPESLSAPGVIPTPSFSTGGALAEALERSLGLAAQGLGVLASIRENEREAERGLASRRARELMPGIADAIERGTIPLPEDGDYERVARAMIARETEGQSDTYKEAFGSVLAPHMLGAMYEKAGRVRQENAAIVLQTYEDSAIAATDQAGISRAFEAAKSIAGVDELTALSRTARAAMISAAQAGDTTRFNAAVKVLGSRFSKDQNQASAVLAAKKADEDKDRANAALDNLDAMVLSGQPGEVVLAETGRFVSRGVLKPEHMLRLKASMAERDARRKVEASRYAIGSIEGLIADGCLDFADTLASTARETGVIDGSQYENLVRRIRADSQNVVSDGFLARIVNGDDAATIMDDMRAATEKDPTSLGYLDPDRMTALASHLGKRDVEKTRESDEAAVRQHRIAALSVAASWADAAARGVGLPLSMWNGEGTWPPTLSDGSRDPLTKASIDQIKQVVIHENMARIADEHQKSKDTTVSLVEKQAQWLARNGVIYEPWKGMMSAAATMFSVGELVNTMDSGKPFTPQETLMQAFSLWRDLRYSNPRVLAAHEDTSSGSLFDMADFALEMGVATTPERAMYLAAKVTDPKNAVEDDLTLGVHPITAEKIVESADAIGFTFAEAHNSQEVYAVIGRLAKLYRLVNRNQPDAAVRRATERIAASTAVSNGYVTFVPVDTPGNLDAVSKKIASDYAAKHEDVDPDELSLVYDRRNKVWELISVPGGSISEGMPVGDSVKRGVNVFTPKDLMDLSGSFPAGRLWKPKDQDPWWGPWWTMALKAQPKK